MPLRNARFVSRDDDDDDDDDLTFIKKKLRSVVRRFYVNYAVTRLD